MTKHCYQCDEEVAYLFDDSRCKDCTRMTPKEVRGEFIGVIHGLADDGEDMSKYWPRRLWEDE